MADDFQLIDQYHAVCLGVSQTRLRTRAIHVEESSRRLRQEASYGFTHVLWWMDFGEEGSAVSVPPGCKGVVASYIDPAMGRDALGQDRLDRLVARLNQYLGRTNGPRITRAIRDQVYACSAATLKPGADAALTIMLRGTGFPRADGLGSPDHCFPGGIAYGVLQDQKVVAIAYARRSGIMEDRIGDLAVETAPAYRGRGFGKAAVAAVVRHLCDKGGEACYRCAPDDIASAATARAVGFVPYAQGLVLAADQPR